MNRKDLLIKSLKATEKRIQFYLNKIDVIQKREKIIQKEIISIMEEEDPGCFDPHRMAQRAGSKNGRAPA